ncbi:MAG TPA: hypothetical protein DCR24_10090, partial [Bacillus bacterium]|nr:hypothetical protein [Bacillus sp. (in: firmicutes)]
VIAVTNPKGGVGKTSLTVNLAAAFARKGKSVAIIDANLQFGEAAVFLNLKPKRTVYEWTKEAFHKDGFPIDQYMTSHESNVSVLAAPSRPEFFEGILEDHLKVAIRECKEIYDVVLIDVPSSLSEIHIGCLEEADDILLVTLNEINVLRMSKLYLETLESVQLQDKVKLVLNRHEKGQALDLKRLAEVLKQEIYAILPDQAQVVSDAIKAGHPYFLSNSRSQLSKAIWSLSEKLIKKAEDQPVKKEKRWSLIKK